MSLSRLADDSVTRRIRRDPVHRAAVLGGGVPSKPATAANDSGERDDGGITGAQPALGCASARRLGTNRDMPDRLRRVLFIVAILGLFLISAGLAVHAVLASFAVHRAVPRSATTSASRA
jgi:hypothetical protein